MADEPMSPLAKHLDGDPSRFTVESECVIRHEKMGVPQVAIYRTYLVEGEVRITETVKRQVWTKEEKPWWTSPTPGLGE